MNNSNKLHIPFNFWFNSNPKFALPLVAIQRNGKIDIDNTQKISRVYNNFEIINNLNTTNNLPFIFEDFNVQSTL